MNQLIDLELTHQPRHGLLKFSWLGLCILAGSLLLAIFVWQSEQTLQARYAALSSNIKRQAQPETTLAKAAPVTSVSISPSETKQIGVIINTLTTPWNALMLAIEQADMPDIALLSIEPNIKKQQILLKGEAKNLPITLRYIEQLEAQPLLHEVYLQKHQVEETDISKPVSFSVLAKWKVAP